MTTLAANRLTVRAAPAKPRAPRIEAIAEACIVLRRIALVGASAAVFLAPLALQASTGPQKHQERASAAVATPAIDVEGGLAALGRADRLDRCDPRPWRVAGATCLQAAASDGSEKIVRIVTVERRVGSDVSVLERAPLETLAAR